MLIPAVFIRFLSRNTHIRCVQQQLPLQDNSKIHQVSQQQQQQKELEGHAVIRV